MILILYLGRCGYFFVFVRICIFECNVDFGRIEMVSLVMIVVLIVVEF